MKYTLFTALVLIAATSMAKLKGGSDVGSSTPPTEFQTLNQSYEMLCPGYEQYPDSLEISTEGKSPAVMTVVFSELANQKVPSSKHSISYTFDVANQKKLIKVNHADDGVIFKKDKTYYDTKFEKQSIALKDLFNHGFTTKLQYGLTITFDDAQLGSGKVKKEIPFGPTVIVQECSFQAAKPQQ